MSTPSITHVRAILALQRLKILVLLAGAKAIYNGLLAAVATFPAPVPTLVILLAQITALETAQQVIDRGSHGTATATRNAARDALWGSLLALKAYVQLVADATPENAVAIIKSAGFEIAAPPHPHHKPILAAALTATSGEVKLVANVAALTGGSRSRVIYGWGYSLDDGHTWVSLPPTMVASTTIEALPLMTHCSFRVCVTLKKVVQPWSQVVTILVH